MPEPEVYRVYAYEKQRDREGEITGKRYFNWQKEVLRDAIDEINANGGVAIFEAHGNEHIKPLLDLLSFFERKGLTITYPKVIVSFDEYMKMHGIKVEGEISWVPRRRLNRDSVSAA